MRLSILTLIACCFWSAATSGPARSDALPKTVWTYSTVKGQNIINDLCIEKLLVSLAQESWILEIITSNNIRTYLSDYDGYRKAIQTSRVDNVQLQQLQLLKLYVLRQYGVLWLDPNVVLLTNLSWVGQLAKLSEINTFEQDSYQLVLFSTASTVSLQLNGERDGEEYQFKQTAVILALKNSNILNDWIEKIKTVLAEPITNQNVSQQQQSTDFLKKISLKALNKVLSSTKIEIVSDNKSKNRKNPLIHYKVWQFTYLDYQQMFEKTASSNDTQVIVDYYIKEDIRSIKKFSGSPRYFISFGPVITELNYILNPSISTLQYIKPTSFIKQLWSRNEERVECMHYILNHSLIYNYLIHTSKLDTAKLIQVHERDILQQCETSNIKHILSYLKLIIGSILTIIFLLLAYKIERIVLGIVFHNLTIKLKQKFSNLRSIFFRMHIPKKSLQPI